jgi:CRP-like cAMP-binding protein
MRKALYILGELDDRDILFLTRAGAERALEAGDRLITAGKEVRDLFIVTDGTLAVTTSSGDMVATLALGDIVGEMSFVENRRPTTSVTATGPAHLLAIPRDAILAEFVRDTAFAARFYRALAIFLSDRLRSATTPDGHGADELDEAVLDQVSDAGDRFIRLLALLEGRLS